MLKVIEESIFLIGRSSNRHNSSDSNRNIINCIDETNDVVSNYNSSTGGAISKTTSGDSDNIYDKIYDGIAIL